MISVIYACMLLKLSKSVRKLSCTAIIRHIHLTLKKKHENWQKQKNEGKLTLYGTTVRTYGNSKQNESQYYNMQEEMGCFK